MSTAQSPDHDTAHYVIDGVRYAGRADALQDALARAHRARAPAARPRCLCMPGGVEMYVACVGGAFLLKRMPGSGPRHDCACPSFEPPAGVSGLGQVLGSAISEDPADGRTFLKLGFPLSKDGRRAGVPGEATAAPAAATSGAKLSLRGLLHFLWEEAGFSRWSPAMTNKRTWPVLRRHLLQACAGKQSRGQGLAESLFLPEAWLEALKDEQAARRRAQLLRIASPPRGPRRLLLLLGEVRRLEAGRHGHRLVVKHAPEIEFELNADIHQALCRRFETELAFWRAGEARASQDGHLVVLGTFSVGLSGRPNMEELVLMYVGRSWLPVEDAFELELIDALTTTGRRFSKSLRYNMAASEPLPCAILTDAGEPAWALFIARPGADPAYAPRASEIAETAGLRLWLWTPGEADMPPLPTIVSAAPSSLAEASAPRIDPWAATTAFQR